MRDRVVSQVSHLHFL